MHQKDNPKKPLAKVKITKEEMHITLHNRKKAATNSPRSALKRKNTIEEGGTSSSKVKKEQESTNLRAQKMMRVIMEPSTIPIVVQVVRQIATIPQIPQEK
jgi:hypothetical protein